jgi:hypothetical protein
MRTALAVLGVALWAGKAHAAGVTTSLRIVVRSLSDATPLVLTLRCDSPRGTVARPGSACGRLLSGGRALFAPTPPGTACSQIYGARRSPSSAERSTGGACGRASTAATGAR